MPKRQPKRPKPPSASELKAEERQRMISSDLEQIRRYIGEIARLMASYRAENVALRAELSETKRILAQSISDHAHADVIHEENEALRARIQDAELAVACGGNAVMVVNRVRAALQGRNGATHASEGQAAAQLLRPQDFATELPEDG